MKRPTSHRATCGDHLLEPLMTRWGGPEWFVVADSSLCIQNPDKLEDVGLHQMLSLPSGEHIPLLFPIAVVDDLDGLKRRSG
ncbi:hypothetical protein ACIOC2_13950 [Streptomyces sp. NPDC088337]|uniref:hypothetical protein n=1 Tax=unclassified Streptomyces TaxID=2593676 RepID=UPI002DDB1B4B|nr:hypothetical protein [Streptomyces sp. NBC_01788]WSB25438.1 hypothetical protein OIE49_05860 [Streptomyces sp. NBC_01788]